MNYQVCILMENLELLARAAEPVFVQAQFVAGGMPDFAAQNRVLGCRMRLGRHTVRVVGAYRIEKKGRRPGGSTYSL